MGYISFIFRLLCHLIYNFLILFTLLPIIYWLVSCHRDLSAISTRNCDRKTTRMTMLLIRDYKRSKEVVSHKYYSGEARQSVAATVCKFHHCIFLLQLRSNRAPDINNPRLAALILVRQDLRCIFTISLKIAFYFDISRFLII